MKVLVSQDNGFRVQEILRPLLSEGEMLLQVTACGVCFSDVHKIRFQRMEDPVVLGHEVAGRVVESSAAKFKVGDRVVVAHHVPCGRCHYCCHGNISMCAEFKKTNLDLDPARRELADSLRSTATFAGSEPDFEESLASMTNGRGADAVLLTAANPPLVPTALSWLRAGGTCLVFASLHPDSDVTLD